MNCSHCGKVIDNGAPVCPHCGAKTAAGPTKSKKKGMSKGKRIGVISVALVLIAGIIAGTFYLLRGGDKPDKNPEVLTTHQNVFASAADAAPENSSNQETLNIFSAAYDTVFSSSGFGCIVQYNGEEVANVRVSYGDNLLSTDVSGKFNEGETTFALIDGVFVMQDYGEGYRVNAAALSEDSSEIFDHYLDLFEDYLVSLASERLGGYDAFYRATFDSLCGSIRGHEDEITNALLSVVEDNHLNLPSLETLVGYGTDSAAQQFDTISSDSVPAIDGTTGVFGIVSDFLATMPEDLIKVTSTTNNNVTKYKIEMNLIDVAEALLDYGRNNDTIYTLIDVYTSVEGGSAREFFDEMQDELDYDRAYADSDDYVVSGSISVSDDYLNSVRLQLPFDESLYIRFSNVNRTSLTDDDLDEVDNTVRYYEVDIQNADDLFAATEDFFNDDDDYYYYDDEYDYYDDDDDYYYDDDDDYYDDDDDYYDDDDDYYYYDEEYDDYV